MNLHQPARSFPPVTPVMGHGADPPAEMPTRSDLSAIRSLGWEIHRLHAGARLLMARVRNRTLPRPLIDFLTPMLADGLPDEANEAELRVEFRCSGGRAPFRVSVGPSVGASIIPTKLLALLHLPALRGFWVRALRRSHFDRLRRILPRAWFLETSPPPPGAIVPGLGVASSSRLPAGGAFLLLGSAWDGGPQLVIEDTRADSAPHLIAIYQRMADRVVLSSPSAFADGWYASPVVS